MVISCMFVIPQCAVDDLAQQCIRSSSAPRVIVEGMDGV